VSPPLIFTGIACGALLAAVGLALWGSPRQVPRLPHVMRAIRWLAGACLLIGTLLAWWGDLGIPPTALSMDGSSGAERQLSRLILMAALAAPPGILGGRHSHSHSRSHWSHIALFLPALVLAGIGLLWAKAPPSADVTSPPVTPVELTILLCAGLGVRALGHCLSELVDAAPQDRAPSLDAAYALLTIVMGSTSLANLCQRGLVWRGTVTESGLAGAWLAWSAAWLGPRQPLWLRVLLTTAASISLTSVALRLT